MEASAGSRLLPPLRGRPQSVLVASAVAAGTGAPSPAATGGLDLGVARHRFEGCAHSMSEDDQRRVHQRISAHAGHDPTFWERYVVQATAAGKALIDSARTMSALADGSRPSPQEAVLEGFVALTDAMQQVAPFIVATPTVVAALDGAMAERALQEAPSLTADSWPGIAERLLTPWGESDPVRDLRGAYRIALEVLASAAATELFVTTAPRITLERLTVEFPELRRLVQDHVEQYGWMRTQGTRFDPLSPLALVDRVQLALVRWPADAIRPVARRPAVPEASDVVGFTPSEGLGGQIAALQAMVSRRCFRVDVCLQAEVLARPFLAQIAELLGCPPGRVLMASVDEIVDALAHGHPLPAAAIEARSRQGFTVIRDEKGVRVEAAAASSLGPRGRVPGALTGMTACRGRAVGRVRIMLDQAELPDLGFGEVLVTAASTIDPTDTTGAGTVFPTRGGGPESLALDGAAAVVADEGGLLSHGAIVCRERGLPCVLGAEWATTELVDGQIVEVDATKPMGVVISLDPPR